MFSSVLPAAAGFLLFAFFMGNALRVFDFKFHLFLLHVGPMALLSFALLPSGLALIQNKASAKGAARAWFAKAHGVTNLFVTASVIVGLVAIFVNKDRMGKAHLSSNHSWAGAAAAIAMAANAAGGLFKLLTKRAWLWRDDIHRYSGLLAVQLAWGAAVSGLYSGWGRAALGGAEGVNATVLALTAVAALTLGAGRWSWALQALAVRCRRGRQGKLRTE